MPGSSSETLQNQIAALIRELRNERDIDANWPAFRNLVENHIEETVRSTSTRWLVSICDTYVDYGDPFQARNAMAISCVVNTIRLAETTHFVRPDIDSTKWEETRLKPVELYDGLTTFAIDRQDTFLNLSRRLHKLLSDDPVMTAIWRVILERLNTHDTIIQDFARNSPVKDRYFPVDPSGKKDNYSR